jgi:hypothetical protein
VSLPAGAAAPETIRVYLRNVGQFLTFREGRALDPLTRRSLETPADPFDGVKPRRATTGRAFLDVRDVALLCPMFETRLLAGELLALARAVPGSV